MKRSVRRLAAVVLTVVLVAALGPSASALISRSYRGETSQGFGIAAKVVSREGRARLKTLTLRQVTLTCEDATEMRWGIGFGWGGGGLPLGPDHVVEWDDDGGFGASEALTFRGRFWPGHARGEVRFTVAALTAEEEAMVCTTGDLTWEMTRVGDPAAASRWEGDSLDGVATIRVTQHGDVIRTSREP